MKRAIAVMMIAVGLLACDDKKTEAAPVIEEKILFEEAGIDLPELKEALQKQQGLYSKLFPEKEALNRLIVQCDKAIPVALLAPLLQTAHEAGYTRIQFAVNASKQEITVKGKRFEHYIARALPVELTEASGGDVQSVPPAGTYEQWLKTLDAAAAKGPLRLRVSEEKKENEEAK